MAKQLVFTTGEVAKICKVMPRTVCKWFDDGRLRGFRVPDSQVRKIPLDSLLRFMTEHEMPIPDDLKPEQLGTSAAIVLNPYQLECLVRLAQRMVAEAKRLGATSAEVKEIVNQVINKMEPQGNSDYEDDEVAIEWKEEGPEGPGLYAWYPEYPEEGMEFLPEVSPNVIALQIAYGREVSP